MFTLHRLSASASASTSTEDSAEPMDQDDK
jgi:hypothetical protein